MLRVFSEALHEYHQTAYARTCADFYATRAGMATSTPGHDVPHGLTAALALLHAAIRAGTPLAPEAKRDLFLQCWRVEMEDYACVVVRDQARQIECPVVRALVLRPFLRLAYFPAHLHIAYGDFSDAAERLAKAARAYDLAVACGWDVVEAAVNSYAHVHSETVGSAAHSAPHMGERTGPGRP
jgi:hypothetical protein